MMDSFLADVERLLAEPIYAVIQREQNSLSEIAEMHNGRFVLFGAGNLGKKSARCLTTIGIRPLAFTDNDPGKWGTSLEDVPVLSPTDAAAKYGRDAAFFITMWNTKSRFGETAQKLSDLGCNSVLSA